MKDYNVFLSPLAEFKLNHLLDYIELKWGNDSKNKFLDQLENQVKQLSNFPESCPVSLIKKGIRKSVITSQTSLYYRIHNKSVEIITVIDNRQNLEKIANEIENYFQSGS